VSTYSLSHLSDSTLLRDAAAHHAGDCKSTAVLLAYLAEIDARKLYLPAAYPSMYAWCLGELHMSEDAARKRIHAARAARRCPALFAAMAEGRLHLSNVVLLAPYLTEATVDELLAAATHKTKFEVEQLIAQRFPRPDVPALVQAIGPTPPSDSDNQRALGRVEPLVLGPIAPPAAGTPRPRVTPLAPERFALQVTIGQPHARPAALRAVIARPPGPFGGRRGSARPRARCAHPPSREAEVRRDFQAAPGPVPFDQRETHPRRGPTRGMGTGSRPVHVRE
jgi:hypothetical protein